LNANWHWIKWTGVIPAGAVHASEGYIVSRSHHNNEWIPGKFHVKTHKAYVPFDGKEVEEGLNAELLVAAPGTIVEWIKVGHGQVGNVGPMGTDGLFVGRVLTKDGVYESGKIHPFRKKFYVSWDGKEEEHLEYEALVIKGPTVVWQAFTGIIPPNAVHASDTYVVARGHHNNEWIPAKLHSTDHKAYVPFEGKEVLVS